MIGTLFFVVIFMLAMGSMAYLSGLQTQGSRAQLDAQSVEGQKGAEDVRLSAGSAGLVAANMGGTGVSLNHLLFSYPNGTVYAAPIDGYIPPRGEVEVGPLVPAGACSPGAESCQSRYSEMLGGDPAGGTLGVLTSMGNTFWYSSTSAGGTTTRSYYLASDASTSSGTFSAIPGMAFAGGPGASYEAEVQLGYYQSAGVSDLVYLGVSVPSDSTFLACADLAASTNPSQASCTSVSGATLAQPTCYAQSPDLVCSYALAIFVSFGPGGGTLQLEFRSNGGATAHVVAGSYMLVSQVS